MSDQSVCGGVDLRVDHAAIFQTFYHRKVGDSFQIKIDHAPERDFTDGRNYLVLRHRYDEDYERVIVVYDVSNSETVERVVSHLWKVHDTATVKTDLCLIGAKTKLSATTKTQTTKVAVTAEKQVTINRSEIVFSGLIDLIEQCPYANHKLKFFLDSAANLGFPLAPPLIIKTYLSIDQTENLFIELHLVSVQMTLK